jgi:hypothetical protein
MFPTYTRPVALLVGGLGLTAATYYFAPPNSHYVVFVGAILFGLVGLHRSWRARREVNVLVRQKGISREQAAALRQTLAAAQTDARLIHDTPDDNYDTWAAARQTALAPA